MSTELTAEQIKKLSKDDLITAVKSGNLKVMVTTSLSAFNMTKTDLPEYTRFAHLRGQEIHQAAAARKYKVSRINIINWTKRGYIRILGKSGQKIMLDEQDVAYCATVYHDRGSQGVWLFNPDGTPYSPKS